MQQKANGWTNLVARSAIIFESADRAELKNVLQLNSAADAILDYKKLPQAGLLIKGAV